MIEEKLKTFYGELEGSLRSLVFKSWEMGKEQHHKSYKYKCKTDIAEKDFNFIKSFLTSFYKEMIEKDIEWAEKEIKEWQGGGYHTNIASGAMSALSTLILEKQKQLLSITNIK